MAIAPGSGREDGVSTCKGAALHSKRQTRAPGAPWWYYGIFFPGYGFRDGD
jgi:hypothetical protein